MPFSLSLSLSRSWLKMGLMILLFCQGLVALAATEGSLDRAWELSRLGEFNAAIHLFHALQENSEATAEEKLQALYGEAHCWNYRPSGSDGKKARALYAQVMDKAPPGDPLASWSDLESAQSLHFGTPAEARDYAAIARSYLEVSRRYPGTPAGEEGYLSYLTLEQSILNLAPADIIQQSEAFIHDHPDSPWISRFYDLMAAGYGKLGQTRKSVECMLLSAKAIKKNTQNLNIDNSTLYWNVGYLAEFELGDLALAREYYGKLIQEYPRDIRVFSAKQALERMNAVEIAVRQGRKVPLDPAVWSRPWSQP
jgi:tetratricopeptide (TPR) repeat protein